MSYFQIFKIKKPFLFLTFFSIISLVYLLSSIQNPKTPPPTPPPAPTSVPADIFSQHPAFKRIRSYSVRFSFSSFSSDHPSTLPLYSSTLNPINLNDIAQKLVAHFNLQAADQDPQLYRSPDQKSHLYLDYKQQIINYNFTPTQFSAKPYSLSRAKTAATRFISLFPIMNNLKLDLDHLSYFSPAPNDQNFKSETNSQKANYFSLPFTYLVDNYPYFETNKNTPPLVIFIGPDNIIYKITYFSQLPPILSNFETKNTLTYQTALSYLNSGKGEIIYLNLMDTPLNTTSLPDITLDSYQIEYRFNQVQKKTVPYFHFYGSFSPNSPVEIILPAVDL